MNNINQNKNYFGFEDYLLCELCLKEPETEKYFTQYHDHAFRKYFHTGNWKCDGIGENLDSHQCKLGLDQSKLKYEYSRYMCVKCYKFNLCDGCINEKYKINQENIPDLSFLFHEQNFKFKFIYIFTVWMQSLNFKN